MERMDGEVDDGKGGTDVVKEDFLPSECNETEPSMSEGIVGITDSLDYHDIDTKDSSTPDPEHFAKAACSSTTVDGAVAADEASDVVDLTKASEIQSLRHVDENVPGDCVEDGTSRPAEPVDSSIGKMEDVSEPTEADESESVAAANEDDGWMYVLGHDQLKKRVLKAGQENTRPTRGQLVTVRCIGQLDDGTTIDEHDRLELCVGEDDFLPAFDLCITLMNEGEICQVVTEARFAYGAIGREPDVPANARITYELELLSVTDRPEFYTMTVSHRLHLSNQKRERGNTLYAREEFSRAVDIYKTAEKIVNTDDEPHTESSQELQQLMDSRVKCCSNLAAAQMKIEAWDAAVRSCDFVLRVQPGNVKALFRKAKCLASKGDYDEASSVLQTAAKVDPNSRVIHQELVQIRRKCREQDMSERRLFEKMLGADKQNLAAAAVRKATTASKLRDYKWLWFVAGAVVAMSIPISLTVYHYLDV